VSNEIKDANLQLLIGLKQHLDQAERLRALLDRLFKLASPTDPANVPVKSAGSNRGGEEVVHGH
jgi:hypothetical protein